MQCNAGQRFPLNADKETSFCHQISEDEQRFSLKQIKTQVQTDFCLLTIPPLPPFLLYLGGSSMLHR